MWAPKGAGDGWREGARRRPSRTLLLQTSLALACALVAFLSASASAAAACPNPAVEYCQFSAGYAGTWQYSETDQRGVGTITIVMKGNWAEVWNGSYWTFTTFSGSLTYTNASPSGPPSCSATFTLNPALAPYYGQQPNGNGGTTGSTTQDTPTMIGGTVGANQITFDVYYPNSDILQSSDTDPTSYCATSTWDDYSPLQIQGADPSVTWSGSTCQYANNDQVDSFVFAVPSVDDKTDNCTVTSNDTNPTVLSASGSLNQTITFSAGACLGGGSCCAANPGPFDAPFGCPAVKPPKPDKGALQQRLREYRRQQENICATARGVREARRANSDSSESDLEGDPELNALCDQAEARAIAANTALLADPPDSRFNQLVVAAPWPAPSVGGSCKGAGRAACDGLRAALVSYASASAQTASVWEALAVVADRWGSAYAAFDTNSNAPLGLALQTALTKVYYGELASALTSLAKSGKALTRALARAGIGRIKLTAAERRKAQMLLDHTTPPAWVVNRLVSDGVETSAAAVRATWQAAFSALKVPGSVNVPASIPDPGSAPSIPGETYASITLQDLYQIAAAVPDAAGRAALTGYVTSANSAGSTAQKHVALEQFITYAKQHERGALSSLLQTAALPLAG